MSTVGIVVPVYATSARLGYLETTLRTVEAQSYGHFRVVVVDDGSPGDAVAEVVRGLDDPRFEVLVRPHEGHARSRNAGAKRLANGATYLCLLDADDVWHPQFVERLVKVLDTDADAVAAYALADHIDSTGHPMNPGAFADVMRTRGGTTPPKHPNDPYTRLRDIAFNNTVYPPSVLMMRTRAWMATGGYDPRLLADDWDMVVQLTRQGPLRMVDDVLVGYRRHDENLSANTRRNVREARLMWARTVYSTQTTPEDRRELLDDWRRIQRRRSSQKAQAAWLALRRGEAWAAVKSGSDALGHLALRRPLRRWAFADVDDRRH